MKWNQISIWEFVGIVVAIATLAFQIFPLFRFTKRDLNNNHEPNSIEISEGLLKVKKLKWPLSGIIIIAVSLVFGITQKSLLLGFSVCATLIFLLSSISVDYMEDAFGSNRFIANLIPSFYKTGAFLDMILFWFLYSQIG